MLKAVKALPESCFEKDGENHWFHFFISRWSHPENIILCPCRNPGVNISLKHDDIPDSILEAIVREMSKPNWSSNESVKYSITLKK